MLILKVSSKLTPNSSSSSSSSSFVAQNFANSRRTRKRKNFIENNNLFRLSFFKTSKIDQNSLDLKSDNNIETRQTMLMKRWQLFESTDDVEQKSWMWAEEMSLPWSFLGCLQVTPWMAWDLIHSTNSLEPKLQVQLMVLIVRRERLLRLDSSLRVMSSATLVISLSDKSSDSSSGRNSTATGILRNLFALKERFLSESSKYLNPSSEMAAMPTSLRARVTTWCKSWKKFSGISVNVSLKTRKVFKSFRISLDSLTCSKSMPVLSKVRCLKSTSPLGKPFKSSILESLTDNAKMEYFLSLKWADMRSMSWWRVSPVMFEHSTLNPWVGELVGRWWKGGRSSVWSKHRHLPSRRVGHVVWFGDNDDDSNDIWFEDVCCPATTEENVNNKRQQWITMMINCLIEKNPQ